MTTELLALEKCVEINCPHTGPAMNIEGASCPPCGWQSSTISTASTAVGYKHFPLAFRAACLRQVWECRACGGALLLALAPLGDD